MSEHIPLQEKPLIDRDAILSVMRNEGPGGKQATERLTHWKNQENARATRGELTRFQYNLALAELYRDAGWRDEARDAFDWCIKTAALLNLLELRSCQEELAELEKAE